MSYIEEYNKQNKEMENLLNKIGI